jgi:hypothetical protein
MTCTCIGRWYSLYRGESVSGIEVCQFMCDIGATGDGVLCEPSIISTNSTAPVLACGSFCRGGGGLLGYKHGLVMSGHELTERPISPSLLFCFVYNRMLLCVRYPVDYGLPGRVQVNPLSTLEEEEDDYTLHPTVQALDVLQHRGKNRMF